MKTNPQKLPAGPELGAVDGSPLPGEVWEIMSKRHRGQVHCTVAIDRVANGNVYHHTVPRPEKKTGRSHALECPLKDWAGYVKAGTLRKKPNTNSPEPLST